MGKGATRQFCITFVGKKEEMGAQRSLSEARSSDEFCGSPIIRLHGSVNVPLESTVEPPKKQNKAGDMNPTQVHAICNRLRSGRHKDHFEIGVCTQPPAKNWSAFLRLEGNDYTSYSLVAHDFEGGYQSEIDHDSVKFEDQLKLFEGRHGEPILQRFMIKYGERLSQRCT